MRQGFKKWNEKTSTSPSGRHLGHDKAIIAFEPKPEQGQNNDANTGGGITDTERILRILAAHSNLAT